MIRCTLCGKRISSNALARANHARNEVHLNAWGKASGHDAAAEAEEATP